MLIVGEHAGSKVSIPRWVRRGAAVLISDVHCSPLLLQVCDVKAAIKAEMIAAGDALQYSGARERGAVACAHAAALGTASV